MGMVPVRSTLMTKKTSPEVVEEQAFELEPIPDTAPFSVVIAFHSNVQCFVSILNNFQSQLLPPRRIIVIDTSHNKAGLDIAQRFNTGNTEIIVECAKLSNIQEVWNRGIELAGNDDVLICNDDLILPINATDIFMIARSTVKALCYVPSTPPRTHYSDYVSLPFSWFARVPDSLEDFSLTGWMPGFCYYLTREAIEQVGLFDTNFEVWFGDEDYQTRLINYGAEHDIPGIIKLESCFVYHFGGKSYKYRSEEVQKKIEKDRDYFAEKYGIDKKELSDVAK